MKVQVQDSTSGDWVRVTVDGVEYHEGHSVPDDVWIRLLKVLGAEVEETEHKPSFFTGAEEDDEEDDEE